MATRQEQVMIHLYGQKYRGNEYVMPYETTQDGIAEAVGISRGQMATVVKMLEDKGLVTHFQRHVYSDKLRRKSRRKCYKLEYIGILTARGLLEASKGVA